MTPQRASFSGLAIFLALLAATCGGADSAGPGSNANTNATGSVQGTVVDNTGAGVPGAAVQLTATGRSTLNTTTSSTGAYAFSSVAVGQWQVSAAPPPGYGNGSSQTVVVAANSAVTAAAVVLPKIPVGPVPSSVDVTITQQAVFSPQLVIVARGGTVRWTNNDITTHTATGNTFDTGTLAPGASSTKTFATVGSFNYVCSLHSGMTGTVMVQ